MIGIINYGSGNIFSIKNIIDIYLNTRQCQIHPTLKIAIKLFYQLEAENCMHQLTKKKFVTEIKNLLKIKIIFRICVVLKF